MHAGRVKESRVPLSSSAGARLARGLAGPGCCERVTAHRPGTGEAPLAYRRKPYYTNYLYPYDYYLHETTATDHPNRSAFKLR